MKKFLIKLVLFGALISAIVLIILSQFGGYVDYFYRKVSSPRQHSLIIGDSRSFQGVQPSIISKELASAFEMPMFNFSFTVGQMAYGEAHLEAIRGKVDPETKNGLFILSVHPWIFAERDIENIAKGEFFETDQIPHNLHSVSMNPNIEHFFKNYSFFHFKALIKRNSIVHQDGWLEEFYLTDDTTTLNKWRQTQVDLYQKFSKKWKQSDYRMKKFEETVAFLKQYGTVVLVRLPVDKDILASERAFWPAFDAEMQRVSKQSGIDYLNYTVTPHNYRLYDGLHLDKKSGALFTKSVADSIKNRLR